MDYAVLTTEEELINERQVWTRICNEMTGSTPFQTWEWNYYWWKKNEPVNSLFVIKAFEGNKIYGYAPLTIKSNVVQFIGGKDIDYGQFVVAYKENTAVEGFIKLLQNKKLKIALQEMPAKGSQIHRVDQILKKNRNYFKFNTTRTARVNLKNYLSFDDYVSLLSQSMRNKTIKVGLKKGISLNQEPITEDVLVEIKEIFEDRQEYRGGSNEIAWAQKIIKDLYDENIIRVYLARKEREAVGFLITMLHKNSQYIWLVAFKNKYRDCFPGQLLFYQLIKDGFSAGNDCVDFMRGDYDFKMRWECNLDSNYSIFQSKRWWPYFKFKTGVKVRVKLKKIVYGSRLLKKIYESRAK